MYDLFLGQKPHNSEKKEKSAKGGRLERERVKWLLMIKCSKITREAKKAEKRNAQCIMRSLRYNGAWLFETLYMRGMIFNFIFNSQPIKS